MISDEVAAFTEDSVVVEMTSEEEREKAPSVLAAALERDTSLKKIDDEATISPDDTTILEDFEISEEVLCDEIVGSSTDFEKEPAFDEGKEEIASESEPRL